MSGLRSRRKGATFERTIAKRFAEGIYPDAKRGLVQARCAKEGPDVEGTPWWVECKAGKSPRLWAALAQAQAATDGRPCLVVAKRDRLAPVVLMTLEDFEALTCPE